MKPYYTSSITLSASPGTNEYLRAIVCELDVSSARKLRMGDLGRHGRRRIVHGLVRRLLIYKVLKSIPLIRRQHHFFNPAIQFTSTVSGEFVSLSTIVFSKNLCPSRSAA